MISSALHHSNDAEQSWSNKGSFFLSVILARYPWIETKFICGCAEYINPACSCVCRDSNVLALVWTFCSGLFYPHLTWVLLGLSWKKGTPTDDLMHQVINKWLGLSSYNKVMMFDMQRTAWTAIRYIQCAACSYFAWPYSWPIRCNLTGLDGWQPWRC